MDRRSSRIRACAALGALACASWAAAQDTTAPAAVTNLRLARSGADVALDWDAVSTDAAGQPETVTAYRVYRGAGPLFPTDFAPLAQAAAPGYTDGGAASDATDAYYLIAAVDDSGNEGAARPSPFTDAPHLDGFWTATTIELSWTPAAPAAGIDAYRVYVGPAERTYALAYDVGPATSLSLTGLEPNRNHFATVVALDAAGHESPMSNEHVDALAGTIDLRVHDRDRLCPFDACTGPPGSVQRRGGQELLIPVDFPQGDWVNITLTYTVESNLCSGAAAPDKCAQGNPDGWDGWNPCGDPWDRTASVYLALNDCIDQGTGCYAGTGNLELLRAITPFGTDAPPPDGTGVVAPTVWTYDVTPLAPVLSGTKWVGAYIATWVPPGWLVTVDFHFSEDPLEASPDPPAAGVAAAWFRDGGNTTTPNQITIPASATTIVGRMFMTGHGGISDATCACAAQGRPCDEFCTKQVQVKVNGTIRSVVAPQRTDCSPLGEFVCGPGTCQEWNACGCPSCTYNRSGWCPGKIACHTNEPCDQDFDATGWFTPGQTYDVLMDVRGMTPGASWANSLTVYWYE